MFPDRESQHICTSLLTLDCLNQRVCDRFIRQTYVDAGVTQTFVLRFGSTLLSQTFVRQVVKSLTSVSFHILSCLPYTHSDSFHIILTPLILDPHIHLLLTCLLTDFFARLSHTFSNLAATPLCAQRPLMLLYGCGGRGGSPNK